MRIDVPRGQPGQRDIGPAERQQLLDQVLSGLLGPRLGVDQRVQYRALLVDAGVVAG